MFRRSILPRRLCGLRWSFFLLSFSACFVVESIQAQETAPLEPPPIPTVNFEKEIAPILRDKCVECHDASLQMADLRLDSRQAMIDAGVLEAGDSESSLLLQRLHDREQGILMPPSGRLSESEIDALKRWVDAGAPWSESLVFSVRSDSALAETQHAIFSAVRNVDTQLLKKLLQDKLAVESVDRYGATPLMYAATYSSVEQVRLLLAHGSDPNAVDDNGVTPLMYAAGSEVEKTKLLLKYGAEVDTKSKLGRTTLLMASAFAGNTPVVKALLDAGADVKYADRRDWTAVVLAARTGDTELVRTLLDAGGEVNGGNAKRLSPGTPLMQTAWANDLASARLLLSRGAKSDQRSLNASLISATSHGYREMVDLLLSAGADPKANIVTNYLPESPILAACGSDAYDIDIVKRLVESKVDLQKKDNRGETPLSLARQRGGTTIVSLLSKLTSTPASDLATAETSADAISGFPDESEIRELTQKSLSLLQSCGPTFFSNSGCTACHQQTATSLVVRAGRERRLQIDERIERQQTKLTAFDLGRKRNSFLQRMKSGGTAHRIGYLLWGLASADYPADEVTDAMYVELAGLQLHNGSWVSDAHRPPTEYSPFSATAVSMRAVQDYSPPGLKRATEERVARATQWLASTPARANSEKAFRLLGLHWGGAQGSVIQQAKDDLLDEQSPNGGWSQLPAMSPDAYATGLTLYALAESRVLEVDDLAYRKGVRFLLRESKQDGSWHVGTRSFAFQPYFESGFPHGEDQWISAAATGWATLALLQTMEPLELVK